MANQPKTPARAVRIDDDTWDRLRAAAILEKVTPSDLVREAVEKLLTARDRAAARRHH